MDTSIKDYLEKKQDMMKKRYNRYLPIAELFVDRWEKARKLGWGSETSVYDSCIVMGDVMVGGNCWVGPNTLLDGTGGGIVIGNHCDISAGVQIYTHDSIERCLTGTKNLKLGRVIIGNNCYIAPQSIISQNVIIGNRCVIAANSFVNKSFEDNCIIAGTPARQIGQVHITEDGNVQLKYFKDEERQY